MVHWDMTGGTIQYIIKSYYFEGEILATLL